jgi:metal-responsive CopG/Arc/MetJ family transcriptional regulator
MDYHMVMSRREILVQMDSEIVAGLDDVAQRHGVSRSEILRRAASAMLAAEEMRLADEELQNAYRATPQEPALVSTMWRLATANIPEW